MLAAHLRFPSRGAMAVRSRAGARAEGPMLTPLPPADPKAPPSGLKLGQFAPGAKPIQDLVGTGIRELFVSMLDSATAVRLGANASKPRYFGTVLPSPTTWRSPSEQNSEDAVRAGVRNAGNAPEMVNKTTAQGSSNPPRIARQLPQRPR